MYQERSRKLRKCEYLLMKNKKLADIPLACLTMNLTQSDRSSRDESSTNATSYCQQYFEDVDNCIDNYSTNGTSNVYSNGMRNNENSGNENNTSHVNNLDNSNEASSVGDSNQSGNNNDNHEASYTENKNDDNGADNNFPQTQFLSTNFLDMKLPMVPKNNIYQGDYSLSIMSISVRFNLPDVTMMTLFKLFHTYNHGSLLPMRQEELCKIMNRNDTIIIRHLYCEDCQAYLGTGNIPTLECPCHACGPNRRTSKVKYFLQTSLSAQLRDIFKMENIDSILQYRNRRRCGYSDDIYSGDEYQKLCSFGNFLSNPYNFSFTINTDGCQVAKSSQVSAWPVFLQINELPPHIRKKHILLAGVFVDNKHPLLNMLLHPIIEELKELNENGITWKDSKQITRCSKFMVTICSVDSPARASILRMKHHNGYFGCTFCNTKGRHINKHIYPIEGKAANERTDEELKNEMRLSQKLRTEVNGVKGISCLVGLPQFSLTKGVIVEAMHAVYLGVVKQHTTLMMSLKDEPFYIGSPSIPAEIDSILLSTRPPSRRARLPRSIKKYKLWKASEWRNWLDYAPVCLRGLIHVKYIKHIAILSQAIHYLNNSSILKSDVDKAEKLLKVYMKKFQTYFGVDNMSFNIHLLMHLPKTVRNWGPIWAHSAFTFESWNKRIVDKVTSPYGRVDQIVSRFLITKYVEGIVTNEAVSSHTKQFITDILGIPNSNEPFLPKMFVNLSKAKVRPLTSMERNCIEYYNKQNRHNIVTSVESFDKAKIHGVEYRKHSSIKKTKYCNSIIYCEGEGFGEIMSIIKIYSEKDVKIGVFVKKFIIEKTPFGIDYIKQIRTTNKLSFVDISTTIITPAIKIFTPNGLFVFKLANCWETD